MTSLRGLWQDCAEWDRRYQVEIDRTNGCAGSTIVSREKSAGGDACDVPPAGQRPNEEGSA